MSPLYHPNLDGTRDSNHVLVEFPLYSYRFLHAMYEPPLSAKKDGIVTTTSLTSLLELVNHPYHDVCWVDVPSRTMTFAGSVLLLLKLAKVHRRRHKFVASRNRKIFCRQSNTGEREIRQRRIPRCSLLSVSHSPWRQVYISNNDQGMITLTGFDVKSFHYFLDLFHPVFYEYSPFIDDDGFIVKKKMGRGRPRSIQSMDCLGLLLAWSRTRGSTIALQLIFGMTMTAVSKYLQFA